MFITQFQIHSILHNIINETIWSGWYIYLSSLFQNLLHPQWSKKCIFDLQWCIFSLEKVAVITILSGKIRLEVTLSLTKNHKFVLPYIGNGIFQHLQQDFHELHECSKKKFF